MNPNNLHKRKKINFLSKIMILIFITFTFGSTLNAGWGGLKYDNYASHISNEIITITINEFELAQKNGDKDLTIYLTFSRKAKNEAGFFSGLFHDDAFIVFKLQGNKDD